jgi:hypothetical protein
MKQSMPRIEDGFHPQRMRTTRKIPCILSLYESGSVWARLEGRELLVVAGHTLPMKKFKGRFCDCCFRVSLMEFTFRRADCLQTQVDLYLHQR